MELSLLIAGACFVLGLLVGGIAGRWRGQHDNKSRELESQVKHLHDEMNQYRDEVGRHFNKTGELFNTMTRHYRDIYQHLATGAQKLSNTKPGVFQLDELVKTPKLNDASTAARETAQPPSDYEKTDTSETSGK